MQIESNMLGFAILSYQRRLLLTCAPTDPARLSQLLSATQRWGGSLRSGLFILSLVEKQRQLMLSTQASIS